MLILFLSCLYIYFLPPTAFCSKSCTKVNKLSVALETMIMLIIVISFFVHRIIQNCNAIPYILLPKFSNNENFEHFGITDYLNRSINPCTDFYDYSCGSWMSKTEQPKYEPIWNNWLSVQKKVHNRIESILKSQEFYKNHLVKVCDMYKACISDKSPETKYLNNLKTLINDFGGWPIITHDWKANNSNWIVSVARITRMLGVHPMLKMHVFIDLYNTSQNILYIEQGELILPQSILVNYQKYRSYIKAYQKWILEIIHYLFPNKTPFKELEIEVTEMIGFEIQLAKLHSYKDKIEKISINKLHKQIPIKWNEIFNELFNGTHISKISSNDKVILRNRKYLMKLLQLIAKTKMKTIVNYIMWNVVKHLSRDTTKYMRKLNFMMDNTIFGIKEDVSQSDECIKNAITYMDIVLISQYSRLFLSQQTIEEVSNMIENIKLEFIKILKNSIWLSDKTKYLAIKKISSLKYIIAYPHEINNGSLFDKVEISNNHFTNILQLRALKMKNAFMKLQQPVHFEWPGSLFEVNAYYSILQNTVFIPVGMLEPPFFITNGSRALNYGALGSLIGHEISHALDVSGRHADKDGNIKNWWPENDALKYEEAVDCLKKQYNTYNSSGISTVGENIADNVGLQISYNAFKNLKSKTMSRLKMVEFSKEQVFFISFSQVWCEISSENELLNEDDYAPVKVRVQGTLQNIKAFSKAFYCKNEKEICTLW